MSLHAQDTGTGDDLPCTSFRWFCNAAPLIVVDANATSKRYIEASVLKYAKRVSHQPKWRRKLISEEDVPMVDSARVMPIIQQNSSVLSVMVSTVSPSFRHKHVLQRFLGDISSGKQQKYRLNKVV